MWKLFEPLVPSLLPSFPTKRPFPFYIVCMLHYSLPHVEINSIKVGARFVHCCILKFGEVLNIC